jgi:hypothetical protein
LARTRSAKMGLPRRQWEDEGTRSNNALVTQVDPKPPSLWAPAKLQISSAPGFCNENGSRPSGGRMDGSHPLAVRLTKAR